MGLKGATGFFQEMMTKVLGSLVHDVLEVYLDDILAHATSEEELLVVLEKIFIKFREKKIVINPAKCFFGITQIEFVGHTINDEYRYFSQKKLDSVRAVALPRTEKQLRGFIGLVNYFRDHIAFLSNHTKPLTSLLQQTGRNKVIEWNDEGREAFDTIKGLIEDSVPLYHYTPGAPMTLLTDASDYGIGAYLSQRIDGVDKPLGFLSKSLSDVQRHWSTPEKEGYAIYFALMKWQHLLLGPHFTIKTDHRNLTYISTSGSAKVMRWKLAIQDFDFEIHHVAGRDNIVADTLSRLPPEMVDTATLLLLESDELPDDVYDKIKAVHNSRVGHHGVERTIDLLNTKGEDWPGRRTQVKKFIKQCPCCQKFTTKRLQTGTHPFTTATYRPMERINVDSIGPLKMDAEYNHILVVIDCFTRFVELTPTKEVGGEEAAEALWDYTCRYGVPKLLLTDGGPQFNNQHVFSLTNELGIEQTTTNAYSKEENAIVERAIKEIVRHLQNILLHLGTLANWSKKLREVQRIINSTTHEPLGVSPVELMYCGNVDLLRGFVTPFFKQPSESIPLSD